MLRIPLIACGACFWSVVLVVRSCCLHLAEQGQTFEPRINIPDINTVVIRCLETSIRDKLVRSVHNNNTIGGLNVRDGFYML